MPGLLTAIFDPAGEGTSSQQSEHSVAAQAEQDLSVDQRVGVDVGITYHDLDGGTHSMQLDNDVGMNADVGAGLDAVLASDDTTVMDGA